MMQIEIKVNYWLKLQILAKKQNQKTQRKKQKRDTYERINALYEGKEMALNPSKSGIFPLPTSKDTGLKK